jgi:hypothetical protein
MPLVARSLLVVVVVPKAQDKGQADQVNNHKRTVLA